MNHNGTLAIIFIYFITSLPLLRNGRSCQFLVYGTSAPGSKVNLYSRFKEQLNATSNFAQSEYDVRTSNALSSIYDLAGDILSEELKHQARTQSDSQNGNYADKLLDGENRFDSQDIPSPAVASSKTNTGIVGNADADAILAKKNLQLINTPVIVSNADQSDHRQARKIQKASRILRRSPHHRLKNLYPRTSTAKRQSSRPSSLPLFSMTLDAEREKLSTISSQSRERPYAILEQQQAAKNNHDWPTLRRNRSSLDAGSRQKMDGLAIEGVESGGDDGNIGDDDSTKPFESSSVKWRKKLQIDGNKNNLPKTRSWPIRFQKEQSNGLIESCEEVDDDDEKEEEDEEMNQQHHDSVGDFSINGTHICTRSTDSFPEVFARPLVESSSTPIIGTGDGDGNGLNEAIIKNANNLLTSVQGVAMNSDNLDDSSRRRIGKQIPTLSGVTLNVPNAAGTNTATGDASSTANFTNVMEKVLDELESLKECKAADETQPEGSPCDVVGSWNSETIGLQFHISIANPSPSSRTFIEGKRIDIELTERVPPRQHNLMECDWFLQGSVVKQVGGPFYMTAQKADRFIVATFAGLCKTCGGIPTIFGSWTFVYPAKDCQDISLAVENKRDILRRDTLEAKRKHRRDRFRSKDKGNSCSHG